MIKYVLLDGTMLDDLASLNDYIEECADAFCAKHNIDSKFILDDLAILKLRHSEQDMLTAHFRSDATHEVMLHAVENNKCLLAVFECDSSDEDEFDNWVSPVNTISIKMSETKDNLNFALAVYRAHVDNDIDLPSTTIVGDTTIIDGSPYASVTFVNGKNSIDYNVHFAPYALESEGVGHILTNRLDMIYSNISDKNLDK